MISRSDERFCFIDGRRYTIGDTLPDDVFPLVEDVYRIDTPAPTRWYVVQTNPQCEQRAESGLVETKADVYMPRLRAWQKIPKRQRSKRGPTRQPVVRPLFPGYVFLGWSWDIEPPWPLFRAVDGVRDILRPLGSRQMTMDVLRLRSAELAGQFDDCVKRRKIGLFVPQFIAMSEAERVQWLVRRLRGVETESLGRVT